MFKTILFVCYRKIMQVFFICSYVARPVETFEKPKKTNLKKYIYNHTNMVRTVHIKI